MYRNIVIADKYNQADKFYVLPESTVPVISNAQFKI